MILIVSRQFDYLPLAGTAAERQVIILSDNNVVILVIGVATFVVAFVGLVVKLIELSRK